MRRIVMARNCGNCAELKRRKTPNNPIRYAGLPEEFYCDPAGEVTKTTDNLRIFVCRSWKREEA